MVTLGIIGCGQWGMNHVRNFSNLESVHVHYCCDQNPDRLSRIQALYPKIHTTASLDEVLNDPAIQAVVVAVPSGEHFSIVQAALEHGKDVLCEKPLTTTAASALELVQLASRGQRILMVGHVFVYNPVVRKLQDYMAQRALGTPYYLSARRTNLGPIRHDVDAAWDLASHDLSIFDFLLGGALPLRVSAYGGMFLTDRQSDICFISVEYPNHVVGHVHVSWLDPQKRREITVVGSEKMAIFNDLSVEAPLWIYDKGAAVTDEPSYDTFEQFRVRAWEGDAMVPHIQLLEPLRVEAEHFLHCVTTRTTPQTDGDNGLRIVQVLEAISASMQQHGQPIEL